MCVLGCACALGIDVRLSAVCCWRLAVGGWPMCVIGVLSMHGLLASPWFGRTWIVSSARKQRSTQTQTHVEHAHRHTQGHNLDVSMCPAGTEQVCADLSCSDLCRLFSCLMVLSLLLWLWLYHLYLDCEYTHLYLMLMLVVCVCMCLFRPSDVMDAVQAHFEVSAHAHAQAQAHMSWKKLKRFIVRLCTVGAVMNECKMVVPSMYVCAGACACEYECETGF